MAEILTDSEIAEIEARENKATPGPMEVRGWHAGIHGAGWHICDPNQKHILEVGFTEAERHEKASLLDGGNDDAQFYSHARTDIPRLIASHRALAAERDNDIRNRQHCEDEVHELKQRLQVKTELLDKTMAQVCAENTAKVELEAQVRELTEQRQEWLVWADSLAGNQHYLPSKMRQEIAERLRTLTEERDRLKEDAELAAEDADRLRAELHGVYGAMLTVESFRERVVRAIRARYDALWIEVGNLPMGSKKSETRCQAELAGELASLVESLPLNEEKS